MKLPCYFHIYHSEVSTQSEGHIIYKQLYILFCAAALTKIAGGTLVVKSFMVVASVDASLYVAKHS